MIKTQSERELFKAMRNALITEAIKSGINQVRNYTDKERSLMGCDSFLGIKEFVRSDIEDAKDSIEEMERHAQEAMRPLTYQEYVDHLSVAARARQQYGATEQQIKLLARLLSDERSLERFNVLTKSEASRIISSMKKEK